MQFILHYYYYTINGTQLSKYAMTVAYEASAARKPIGCKSSNTSIYANNRFNMPFLEKIKIYYN